LYNYLIVGHGIAGALLAHKLDALGKTFRIINDSRSNQSSSVAAGLYNPITGRKMIPTWMADQLFEELEPTYEKLERKLNGRFLYKIGIYRPFASAEQQNDWECKQSDDSYSHFVARLSTQPSAAIQVNDPLGGIHLKPAGYVDVNQLLTKSKNYFKDKGIYEESVFYEHKLTILGKHFDYENRQYKRLVFCNGIAAHRSKFFSWLPFNPVKGEMMNIRLKKPLDTIYNRGVFVLPKGAPDDDFLAKVGATYAHNFSDLEPTEKGKVQLTEKLSNLLMEDYDLLGMQAGVRPATLDRRPFLGNHPKYEHIYLFNGFGSKGVSMIPYFSNRMVDFIEQGKPLPSEVSIKRHSSLYN